MIYVILNSENKAVGYSESDVPNSISRWDFESFEHVERIAAELTEATGMLFIPTDASKYVSPRYDVIIAPKVGDKVSSAFNGDYYPEGEIVSVSESLKVVTTSTGKKFYRKRETGRWLFSKTWTLVQGHKEDRNPHF